MRRFSPELLAKSGVSSEVLEPSPRRCKVHCPIHPTNGRLETDLKSSKRLEYSNSAVPIPPLSRAQASGVFQEKTASSLAARFARLAVSFEVRSFFKVGNASQCNHSHTQRFQARKKSFRTRKHALREGPFQSIQRVEAGIAVRVTLTFSGGRVPVLSICVGKKKWTTHWKSRDHSAPPIFVLRGQCRHVSEIQKQFPGKGALKIRFQFP